MLSFWENNTLSKYDFVVVGAGIMGCSVAYELRQKYPNASIVVLERGIFPTGASTKNAGFMCYGSPTEILHDIALLGEQKAIEIVWQRFEGLKILTERFGNDKIDTTNFGGNELIIGNKLPILSQDKIDYLNTILMSIFKFPVFSDFSAKIKEYGFSNAVNQLLFCAMEKQIDSGKLMTHYWKLLQEKNIQIKTGANVKNIQGSILYLNNEATGDFVIAAEKIVLCTNAFINELVPEMPVKPGRGQVIITNEIENLPFKGSFHFDEGFYYFRNIGKRVLFGGGRNLDFEKETSSEFVLNTKIHSHLEKLLRTIILPETKFEIEQRWCGIMGVGDEKKPIVKQISPNVVCAVRMGGMGVAIGSLVGKLAIDEF